MSFFGNLIFAIIAQMLCKNHLNTIKGSRVGAVVRALTSHQCVPGLIPGPGVICGLSLLLVLFSVLRAFSPGTPVFPSPQKPTFPNSNSILECTAPLNEFFELHGAPWVNKIYIYIYSYKYNHMHLVFVEPILHQRDCLYYLNFV